MTFHLVDDSAEDCVPVAVLDAKGFESWRQALGTAERAWLARVGFEGKAGQSVFLPAADGGLAAVAVGTADSEGLWAYARLPRLLPEGTYRLEADLDPAAATLAALGWALGTYAFGRYRETPAVKAALVWPAKADRDQVVHLAEGVALARDLVNTPANDMLPPDLAEAATKLAGTHGAQVRLVVGDDLLDQGYRTIHAVGRASTAAPRLIDLRWGDSGPKVSLVGKGVCFDSGGLDLKPAGGMKLMKKDMGGSAQVLGLASAIMAAGLKVRLRVLVPAVENSVAGNAMRPLDIIETYKGLTVEVGNTDAEGRLVLADALHEAMGDKPDLVVDCATLTGAARVALGTDLPALFCNDDATADRLLGHCQAVQDPLWRMPLYQPYRDSLKSKVADLNNISDGPYGGAITAALFLESFVTPGTPWIHIDLMAWNLRDRPGRPTGGEAMGLRALYALIAEMAGSQ